MTGQLETTQCAELEHVADTEAVGAGIEAGVDGHSPRIEPFEEIGVGHLVDQATKGEVLRKRGHDQTLPYATSLVIA